jgi:hypothetical protein
MDDGRFSAYFTCFINYMQSPVIISASNENKNASGEMYNSAHSVAQHMGYRSWIEAKRRPSVAQ